MTIRFITLNTTADDQAFKALTRRATAKRLLTAASAAALAAAAPGLTSAHANGFPQGCGYDNDQQSQQSTDNITVITCTGEIEEPIETFEDSLTLNIGDENEPGEVNILIFSAGGSSTIGGAVDMNGHGKQTLNITEQSVVNADSNILDGVNIETDGPVVVNAAGRVTGVNGFSIRGGGEEGIQVNVNEATGREGDGVRIFNRAGGGDVIVKTTGRIQGQSQFDASAVAVVNEGNGRVEITSEDIVRGEGFGISVNNGVYVNGGGEGPHQEPNGPPTEGPIGGVAIIAADVIGNSEVGIYVDNSERSEGDVSVTSTGDVFGGETGVEIRNMGKGGVTIDVNSVDGFFGDGVHAVNGAFSQGGLSVKASGRIAGGGDGVYASNGVDGFGPVSLPSDGEGFGAGSGDLSISVGEVIGFDGDGIRAENGGNPESEIIIVATGRVSGGESGVYAENYGGGGVSVETVEVQGGDKFGIYVRNGDNFELDSFPTDVEPKRGSGGVSITANGAVSSGDDAINVENNGDGGVVIVANGDAIGGDDGVNAADNGAGGVEITTRGAVVGRDDDGIDVNNELGGGVTILAEGDVSGDHNGVEVDNEGDGLVSITLNGSVSAVREDGINVENEGDGGVTIIANGDVESAEDDAVFVRDEGAGRVSVTTNGKVSSDDDAFDIKKEDGAGGVFITVNGEVNGGNDAIDAANEGDGGLTILTTAKITADETGIEATDRGDGGVSITAQADVAGGDYGIIADNYNGGGIDIVATGAVSAEEGVAIGALNAGEGDLSITAEGSLKAEAGFSAIAALNIGAGDLSVQTGDAVGGLLGVMAINTGQELSIDTDGEVSGEFLGIGALNLGKGGMSVEADGPVNAFGAGIAALNLNEDLSIVANGGARGELAGVLGLSVGAGPVSITTGGPVEAGLLGVLAVGAGDGVSITANGDVTSSGLELGGLLPVGGDSETEDFTFGLGVTGLNLGGGDLTIDASGTVAGDIGVLAANGLGGYVIELFGVIAGGDEGAGSGEGSEPDHGFFFLDEAFGFFDNIFGEAVGETFTEEVDEDAFFEIFDRVLTDLEKIDFNADAGDVTINVVDVVSEGPAGVLAVNSEFSAGGLSVTSTGAIEGAGAGIVAFNGVSIETVLSGGQPEQPSEPVDPARVRAGDLVIDVVNVTASDGDAILAYNGVFSAGDVSVAASGDVTGAFTGVNVYQAGDGDVTVTALGSVKGEEFDGVNVFNEGTGATSLSFSGSVSGGEDGYGVYVDAAAGASVVIDTGGAVSGSEGAIMLAGDGADRMTVNAGGAINGSARLNGGDDVFVMAGGTFTDVRGGAGVDKAVLAGPARTINGLINEEGGVLSGFEMLTVDADGLTLAGTYAGFKNADFVSGVNTLTGTLDIDMVTIADGASLIVDNSVGTGLTPASFDVMSSSSAGGATVTGDMMNAGTLTIGGDGGVSTLTVTGDFTQAESGKLIMDVVGDNADLLSVNGDVTLAGDLVVTRDLLGTNLGDNTIRLIDGDGTLAGSLNLLVDDGLLVKRELVFDDTGANIDLVVTLNDISVVEGLNGNQREAGGAMLSLLADPALDDGLATFISGVVGLDGSDEMQGVLAQLHPEGLDVGLKALTVSQRRFAENALAGSSGEAFGAGRQAVEAGDGLSFWASLQGVGLSQGGDNGLAGFDGGVVAFSAGVADIETGRFSFGFAGGYSDFSGESDGGFGDNVDTQSFHAGASAGVDLDNLFADGWLMRADAVFAYAGGETEIGMGLRDPQNGSRINQRGEADTRSFDVLTRLAFDGTSGEAWPVRPYADFGLQAYRQDAVVIGAGQATALAVEELDNTVGFAGLGVAYERQWGERFSIRGQAAGVRYFGDTENVFNSRFAVAPQGQAFVTVGQEVETQVELEAALAYKHRSGFVLDTALFGETGDLNLYGARLTLSKRF